MIYVGYPCIGKSSIAGRSNFIDLESSMFTHSENWEEEYVKVALGLSAQGFNVFLSSHKNVRDALNKNNIAFICVFPAANLENNWFERLSNRYKSEPSEKNLRALSRWQYFKQDIADLQKEKYILVLHDCNYDLIEALKDNTVQTIFAPYFTSDPLKIPTVPSRSGKTINDIWENEIDPDL